MFFEQRTYTIAAQRVPEYLDVLEAGGAEMLAPMKPHLAGHFVCEIGRLNQVISLYRYDSFEQRASVRSECAARSKLEAFVGFPPQIKPLLVDMESRILMPTALSPLR